MRESRVIVMDLTPEFYQEEVRCGYLVSAKMKKIWAAELDLLDKFSQVCERYGLRYFIGAGTLLGAVRHKGFIPWDDDVDVILPREDYDRLWEIAEQEFKPPYFFQTTLSENGFCRTHAQLRNSNTTGCIQEDASKDINRGIFLDVFPMDSLPDDPKKQASLRRELDVYKKILDYEYNIPYEVLPAKGRLFYHLIHLFFRVVPYKAFFQHFNHKVLGKYSADHTTEKVADLSLAWRDCVHWKREWFTDFVYLPFENLQLRAPYRYKEVLSHQYGDYMRIPDDVTAPNGRCHGEVLFEPDIPYEEYFRTHPQERGTQC